jgi:hypothetical protein
VLWSCCFCFFSFGLFCFVLRCVFLFWSSDDTPAIPCDRRHSERGVHCACSRHTLEEFPVFGAACPAFDVSFYTLEKPLELSPVHRYVSDVLSASTSWMWAIVLTELQQGGWKRDISIVTFW